MRYKFVGDMSISMPEYGHDRIETGDVVEMPEEINSPLFKKIEEPKKEQPAASKQENK